MKAWDRLSPTASIKNELTEARRIILALAGIRDRLKECDVKFLESWQSYLQNALNHFIRPRVLPGYLPDNLVSRNPPL